MKFDEEPNYAKLISLFYGLIESYASRPIRIDGALKICTTYTIAGTPYTQQSYKVSESFPYKWINKKWKEGFHVTSMATAGNRWGVVMSRNSGYSNQVTTIAWPYAFFVPHAYLFIFL